MNIHRALADVANMRAQLDRAEARLGFRSTAVGLSVLFLAVGYVCQNAWVEDANASMFRFLTIWLTVALASGLTTGVEMAVRGFRSQQSSVWKLHRRLLLSILPCLLAGTAITFVVCRTEFTPPEDPLTWTLPGVWSMIYSLGLFNCLPRLPRYSVWVASYFLGSSMVALVASSISHQPDAWQMLLTFGVGHAGLAAVF